MLTLKFDTTSTLHVEMPANDEAIIELARAYVAQESAQPVEAQLAIPALSAVQNLLAQAEDAVSRAETGERERAKAYGRFRQAYPQAQNILRKALAYLRVRCWDNLEELEDWGFDTVISGSETVVHLPERQADWIKLLNSYVAHESSLLPEQQVPLPPLAEVQALRDTVVGNYFERLKQRNIRIAANAERAQLCARLYDRLQVAAAVLVGNTFDGEITLLLRDWGYDVATRTVSSDSTDSDDGLDTPGVETAGTAMAAETAVPLAAPMPAMNGAAG